MADPVIVEIAAAPRDSPGVGVVSKWAVHGVRPPIPMSTKRRNYLANLRAVVDDPLRDEEMAGDCRIDRNCRLVKGQVFSGKTTRVGKTYGM